MADVPLHRFEEYGSLTASERIAVLHLADAPIEVRKAHIIRREGVEVNGFYILLTGWASAGVGLPNGSRQLLKIHLPGDALGTPSMAMKHTTEELCALTDVTLARVPLTRFGRLFDEHPRIVARFMLSVQQERVALMDRLASMGRTSAAACVAGFLLDMFDRLRPLNLVDGFSFEMPVSQEAIGDLLGLTAVHVNRMLAELSRLGLIERSAKRVHLLNVKTLAKLAARPSRMPSADQSWTPAAR